MLHDSLHFMKNMFIVIFKEIVIKAKDLECIFIAITFVIKYHKLTDRESNSMVKYW